LATGCSFSAISFYFARGNNTIRRTISETTVAIWNCLHETYMPTPDKNGWKEISGRFQELWDIPNCIGAIGGKHIRIHKLPGSISENFNYKAFHSVVLMACADADGNFMMIETGYAGRNSGGGIFKASRMNNWLQGDELNLPDPETLPFDDSEVKFPYYFVADEA
jgi:hypothetical protein